MTTEPAEHERTEPDPDERRPGGDPLEPDLPDPAPEFESDDEPDEDHRPPGLPAQEPA